MSTPKRTKTASTPDAAIPDARFTSPGVGPVQQLHSDMLNLAAHLTGVIVEQLAPLNAKVEELSRAVAIMGERDRTVARIEVEKKELEGRVRLIEDKLSHLYGAGGVAGVGGKWIAGIFGSVLGGLFIASAIAIVSKLMH